MAERLSDGPSAIAADVGYASAMPKAYGSDRVEEAPDGRIVLRAAEPKGWEGRSRVGPRMTERPGTAVRWDDEFFEVLEVSDGPAGEAVYMMAPWEERHVLRAFEEYSAGQASAQAPGPFGGLRAPGAAPSTVRSVRLTAARKPTRYPWLANPWTLVGIGLALAIVAEVRAIPLTGLLRFLQMGIGFLTHEVGHAVFAWFFGSFALPTPLLTIVFEPSLPNRIAVVGALLVVGWIFRASKKVLVAVAATVVAYPILIALGIDALFVHLGGHGAEVLCAAFFLWQVVRGGFFRDWERPGYALLGALLWVRNVVLDYRLVTDAEARTDYLSVAITGVNDFVKVADELGTRLESVAAFMLLFSLVVPALALGAAWWIHRARTAPLVAVPVPRPARVRPIPPARAVPPPPGGSGRPDGPPRS